MADKKEISELLNKISKFDDQQAFKELYDHYHSWLFSVAYMIIKSYEDAEEILEDVFVKILQMRGRYVEIKNIETYLFTAIKNKSYDKHRKKISNKRTPIRMGGYHKWETKKYS